MNQTKKSDSNPKGARDTTKQRLTAKRESRTTYITGIPCRQGHNTYRYTASGQCAECASIKAKGKWKAGVRPDATNRPAVNRKWNESSKGGEAKRKWKLKDPKRAWAVYAAGGAKSRANLMGLPFSVDSKYVLAITPDVCPVFGTPFKFVGGGKISDESATLDRLVPSLGYVPGNVAVISMKANRIKSAYNSQDTFKVAEWLEKMGL